MSNTEVDLSETSQQVTADLPDGRTVQPGQTPDRGVPVGTPELDGLRSAYTRAVDQWVIAIRQEESLATADHSDAAWELWEHAGFKAKECEERTTAAKEAYKDGLRKLDYGF